MSDKPEPILECVEALKQIVTEVSDDDDALSVIGAELASALVGDEALTRVVTSALVCALSVPSVSETSADRAISHIADCVQVSRAQLSAAGTA